MDEKTPMAPQLPPKPTLKRRFGVGRVKLALIVVGIIGAAAAISLPLLRTDKQPAGASTDRGHSRGVRVTEVALAPFSQNRSYTGTVSPRYEAPIGFRVPGKVLKREVEVGQAVREGDILFALDPADYLAALSAAEANFRAAKAQAVQSAADEIRQAQLLAQGWTTQAAFDRYKAASQTAQNQAQAAENKLNLARNDLSYTELRAPHDGVITAIRAEVGQVLPVGQPVLSMVRPGDREALIMIPEGQIGDIRSWTANASFWNQAKTQEPAILREIAPQADPTSRTYAVRFSLPASAETAELGSTVTITLRRSEGNPIATIPSSAVLFRNGTSIVWRIMPSSDRIEAVPVVVERLGNETTDVTGLTAGDLIVTLGVHRLDEGEQVRVVEGPRTETAARAVPPLAKRQDSRP